MIRSLFFLMSLFCLVQADGQAYDFPEDWVGDYAGTMLMHYPTVSKMDTAEVHFELKEVIPDSVWTYIMSYQSKKYGEIVKDYFIVKPEKHKPYLYHLDEKDGIVIEQILMDNTFYSSFSVLGSYISSRMRRVEGGIEFEITSAKEEPTYKSDNIPIEDDLELEDGDLIEVYSYLPFTVQRVFLQEVD